MIQSEISLFAGTSNIPLSQKIATELNTKLGRVIVDKFCDGELKIEYLDSLTEKKIFLLQSTCAPQDSNLMELLLLADAAKRQSVGHITAIIPYLGYSRQDRRMMGAKEPISAKLIANLLKISGINKILTVSLHTEQLQGFFDIPISSIPGHLVFINDKWCKLANRNPSEFTVVAPDCGSISRARHFSSFINKPNVSFIDKYRSGPNTSEALHIIGNVKNKICLLIDDIVDTGGTLISAAKILKKNGAKYIVSYCVHPVLSDNALNNIQNSDIDELIVSDSIQLPEYIISKTKIKQLSIATAIANKISQTKKNNKISLINKNADRPLKTLIS
ncbi:MAG: ribose-phosphate diphosphokinase [Legionellales bacterium]|nr:ribose-phosphate diphosphokinase [Legionellales bacterium]